MMKVFPVYFMFDDKKSFEIWLPDMDSLNPTMDSIYFKEYCNIYCNKNSSNTSLNSCGLLKKGKCPHLSKISNLPFGTSSFK